MCCRSGVIISPCPSSPHRRLIRTLLVSFSPLRFIFPLNTNFIRKTNRLDKNTNQHLSHFWTRERDPLKPSGKLYHPKGSSSFLGEPSSAYHSFSACYHTFASLLRTPRWRRHDEEDDYGLYKHGKNCESFQSRLREHVLSKTSVISQ